MNSRHSNSNFAHSFDVIALSILRKKSICRRWFLFGVKSRGGTRMARGGIRLVHGLTKSTLITYYSGMKKDPKYAFLHAFFLIFL